MWLNIPGGYLSQLTNDARFPSLPDQVGLINSFESPAKVADSYGVRLSGYLRVPATGNCIFYLSSDDNGALYFSPDDDPSNKQLIAFEPDWSGYREWTGDAGGRRNPNNPENVSPALYLVAGQWYYVEALMKERNGPDYLGVTWRMPGADPVTNGAEPIPGIHLGTYPAKTARPSPPVITQ